jgi:hypothetical protein
MIRMRWMTLLDACITLAACTSIASCAVLQPPLEEKAPGPGDIAASARAAAGTVSLGKSTKADVRAALGEAVVIPFDSGYEVWVYREKAREKPQDKEAPPATELVLLFDPSGVATKMRVR